MEVVGDDGEEHRMFGREKEKNCGISSDGIIFNASLPRESYAARVSVHCTCSAYKTEFYRPSCTRNRFFVFNSFLFCRSDAFVYRNIYIYICIKVYVYVCKPFRTPIDAEYKSSPRHPASRALMRRAQMTFMGTANNPVPILPNNYVVG